MAAKFEKTPAHEAAETTLATELKRLKDRPYGSSLVPKVEAIIEKYGKDTSVLRKLAKALNALNEVAFIKDESKRRYSSKLKMESGFSITLDFFARTLLLAGGMTAAISLCLAVAVSGAMLAAAPISPFALLSGFLGGFLAALLSYPFFELADYVNFTEFTDYNLQVEYLFSDEGSALLTTRSTNGDRTRPRPLELSRPHTAPLGSKLITVNSANIPLPLSARLDLGRNAAQATQSEKLLFRGHYNSSPSSSEYSENEESGNDGTLSPRGR